ncbi:fatty acid hydroxylase [Comamonas serinivorans]|uniref:Fatty acid hydroxylase n=1 Tax=Comamonas serinivorans TaxID=1082851 RepID=A0A1Y0ELW4_9BURK|nr:sterol desaturase family protein [Comamonas serinivorans]ARU04431.1 fatty acid hydroxylase [Comamonas serinivorans]
MQDLFAQLQGWLFETLVQPLAFAVGAGNLLEDGYVATAWLLYGVLQIAVLVAVIGPLQRRWPVEPVQDRAAIRVDVIYTLLHRLGLFKLAMFFTFENWVEQGLGLLRAQGLPTLHIDQLWPGVSDQPLVSFAIYLVVFDAVAWAMHWAQHRWDWWWRLHAVHHSQRQMTMWSDNRNHLVDSVLTDLIVAVLALLIGVAPSQFIALVAVSQLLESLQHANLRWRFGAVGERLLISPSFHRRHHAIWLGHSPQQAAHQLPADTHGEGLYQPIAVDVKTENKAYPYGANFGVLFPWWDMLARTADFTPGFGPTGIDDQVTLGRDYGRGFWAQQWLGLLRLFKVKGV